MWMFIVSILLCWLPILGPIIAGFVGGRKAGGLGNALIAALIPALVLTVLIIVVLVPTVGTLPVFGSLLVALIGGVAFVFAVVQSGFLLVGALIGGAL